MIRVDTILSQANIIVPESHTSSKLILTQADIGITNGKISAIGSCYGWSSSKNINCKGLTILPGVIDSQVHFRDPGLTHKEDLSTGTLSALRGGVTSIFEMPNTNPSTTDLQQYEEKLRLAQEKAHVNYGFFIGASTENLKYLHELENQKSCPGIKVFMGSSTGSLLVEEEKALIEILKNTKKRIIVHSEDEARLKERKSIAIEGQNPKFHPIWRDEQSAFISTKRLLDWAEKLNRNVHVLHVSSAEEMEFLKNKKKWATIEVLPQHLTLSAPDCYDRLGNLAQQNPPIRDKRHQEYLWKAVQNGYVDVLGSDHAPHTLEEKMKVYPNSPSGMPGVQTFVPIMLNHINEQKISLLHWAQMVTENPRKIFGLQNKGRIALGFDADFTILDLNLTKKISNSWILSKCGWTPFDGMTVKGWVNQVYLHGDMAMCEDEILLKKTGQPLIFNQVPS